MKWEQIFFATDIKPCSVFCKAPSASRCHPSISNSCTRAQGSSLSVGQGNFELNFSSCPALPAFCCTLACMRTKCEGVYCIPSSAVFWQPNSWSVIEGTGQIRNPDDRVMLGGSKNSTGQRTGIQVHGFQRPEMPVKLKSGFCFALSPPTFSKDVLLFSAASLLL